MSEPQFSRQWLQEDMAEPQSLQLVGGHAIVFSRPSPAKSTPNEDTVAVIQLKGGRLALAVADGLGGHRQGCVASRVALEELIGAIERADPSEPTLRGAILDGIETANRRLLSEGSMATTLCVVEILGRTARSYHVGDSLVLITGQRGRLKFRTVSHSPVGYMVEAGLLDEDEAMHHAERNVVANALGTEDMRIEIGPEVQLAARDTVLVASDGLSDNLYPQEIIDLVRKGSLERVGAKLLETAKRRMDQGDTEEPSHPDDLSYLVFRPA